MNRKLNNKVALLLVVLALTFTFFFGIISYALDSISGNSEIESVSNAIISDSFIYVEDFLIDDIEEVVSSSTGITMEVTPSPDGGGVTYLGTGSTVSLYEDENLTNTYTLVVYGDINGDSVSDVLDAFEMVLVCNGFKTLSGPYFLAGDLNSDGIIDSNDYQIIINIILGNEVEIPEPTTKPEITEPSTQPDVSEPNSYTVTFVDYDGTTVISTSSVEAGGNASLPAAPTKSGVTFLGWSGNYLNVTQNEIVKAVYSDEKNVICVESVKGSVGDTITLLVDIDGVVKTCGFDFTIMYDPALELVSSDADLDLDVVSNANKLENGIILNFSAASDKTKQRDIIELTFKINDTEKAELPISLSVTSIKEVSGNYIVDAPYSVVNGVVTVQ